MRLSAPLKAATQRLALPFLIAVSVVLIFLGKADVLLFDRWRGVLTDVTAPLLELASAPVATAAAGVQKVEDVFNVYRENAALREENARLLQWQDAARRLADDNRALRDMGKLVPDSGITFISARVIADSGGAFARNVLVNAGSSDGVARGQAATTGDGLVGRIAEVGGRTARVLLLTDLNSHVPVMIEGSHERAMLDGDNTTEPMLVYVQPKAQVKIGDRIVTSGSGGVFPPGLPVGQVVSVDGGVVRIEPCADLSGLDMVRIIDYGLGGLLPQSAVPPTRAEKKAKSSADTDP